MLSPEDISAFWTKLNGFVFAQMPVVIFMLATTLASLTLWMRSEDKSDLLRQALVDCHKEKAGIIKAEGEERTKLYQWLLEGKKDKDTAKVQIMPIMPKK